MMLFPDHFSHGFLPVAIAGELSGMPNAVTLPAAIGAGLYNAWPDLWPFLKALIDREHPKVEWWDTHIFGIVAPTRGDVYMRMHKTKDWTGDLAKWFPLHHWGGDKWLHDGKGPWWPRLWYVAVPFWTAEAVGIWLYIKL